MKKILDRAAVAVIYQVDSVKGVLIYLARRKAKRDIGKWECPGGVINEDESYLVAAIREIYEETGILFENETEQSLFWYTVEKNSRNMIWGVAAYAFEYNANNMPTPHITEPDIFDAGGFFLLKDRHRLNITMEAIKILDAFERNFCIPQQLITLDENPQQMCLDLSL